MFYLCGIFALLPVASAATYCEWAPINGYGSLFDGDKGAAYLNGLTLFPASSCSGSSCQIPTTYGSTTTKQDNLPLSGLSYTCDNVARPILNPVTGQGTHTRAYICTVSHPINNS